MSDNPGGKLKLNLAAKEFKPKFLQQQNQNQQNVQNPYMGYDMNSPYSYMNYGMMPNNPYAMPYGGYGYNPSPQGYMNQPQFPNQNSQKSQQQPQTQNPPPQTPTQKK